MNQASSHFSSNPSLHISPMAVSSPLAAMPTLDPSQASLTGLQQIIGMLDSSLRLPNNPRAFMVYLVGLLIVFAGAFMHILVAAQIMQAEFTLSQLQGQYRALEQQNGDIIFQIARDSNMARLQERVIAQGYVPVQEREYIFVPSQNVAAAPSEALATATQAASTPSLAPAVTRADMATTTTQPATALSLSATNNRGGDQFARWDEFWYSTWRRFTGRPAAISPSTTANASTSGVTENNVTKQQASDAQPSKASPNFWSVWWEQAAGQGSKLLEQFRRP